MIMKYKNIVEGIFVKRPNRFIAQVIINGHEETVHVKNTGRCKELLVPGVKVYLEHFSEGKRKTAYDLIAVEKNNLLINMDSQAPNKVAGEWLLANEPFGKITYMKAEYTHGDSRFDYYLEMGQRKMLLEVKGVTLEENGIAKFPDAPTERGVKHIRGLMHCLQEGYEAAILFVIQFKDVRYFVPNWQTHLEFGEVLREAHDVGVKVLARECEATTDSLVITSKVEIKYDKFCTE